MPPMAGLSAYWTIGARHSRAIIFIIPAVANKHRPSPFSLTRCVIVADTFFLLAVKLHATDASRGGSYAFAAARGTATGSSITSIGRRNAVICATRMVRGTAPVCTCLPVTVGSVVMVGYSVRCACHPHVRGPSSVTGGQPSNKTRYCTRLDGRFRIDL